MFPCALRSRRNCIGMAFVKKKACEVQTGLATAAERGAGARRPCSLGSPSSAAAPLSDATCSGDGARSVKHYTDSCATSRLQVQDTYLKVNELFWQDTPFKSGKCFTYYHTISDIALRARTSLCWQITHMFFLCFVSLPLLTNLCFVYVNTLRFNKNIELVLFNIIFTLLPRRV